MFSKHSTSVHEVSHALVQTMLRVGPRKVSIIQTDRGWEGQSLADDDASGSEKLARLLVAQLAGPIGQTVVDPDSLGPLRPMFEARLLEPSIMHFHDPKRQLNLLGWEGDLVKGCLMDMARCAHQAWKASPLIAEIFYKKGGFLFHAEEAIFEGFRDESVRDTTLRLASVFMEKISWNGGEFRVAAQAAIESPAWNKLKSHDFMFRMSVIG